MSASKKSFNQIETNNTQNSELETDVLFQKIYDKWYAFSVVNEDCLMTEVPESEVQKRMNKKISFFS